MSTPLEVGLPKSSMTLLPTLTSGGGIHSAFINTTIPLNKPTQEEEMIEITNQLDLDAGLADLAADLTQHFAEAATKKDAINTVTLRAPMLLTVEKKGKGYSKVAHIGQEEFIPTEAYVGKKGKILLKFTPKSAATYESMEMSAEEGLQMLDGLSYLMEMPLGGYTEHIRRLNTAKSAIREQEQAKDKFDQYQHIGFGSF